MVLGTSIKQKGLAATSSQESFSSANVPIFAEVLTFIPQAPPEPLITGNASSF